MTKSAIRALEMMEALGAAPMTHGALAEKLRIPRSSLSALLNDLHDKGYVRLDAERRYNLGTRLLALAADFARDLDLTRVATPIVNALAAEAAETAAFAMWISQDEMLVIARRNWPSPLMYSVQIGDRAPVHASASGQAVLGALPPERAARLVAGLSMSARTDRTIIDRGALLEKLETVRNDGDAVCDQELIAGIITTSAAVRDENGEPIGALSLSVPTPRLGDRFEGFRHLVRRAANGMSDQLRGTAAPQFPTEDAFDE